MVSLLSKELENFDYTLYNKFNNKCKNEYSNYYEEKVENNIQNKLNNNNNEYSLNTHIFNPTKNSPPNEWQYRLIKRINSFNSRNILTNYN